MARTTDRPTSTDPRTPRRHRSFRLHERTLERLERRAQESAQSLTSLAERYLDEGLRLDRHPGVVFVDGPAGRRPRLAGSGLDVWEVVETIKDGGNSVEAAAAYLDIQVSRVNVAIRYYADHREEIDAWTERVHRVADQEAETDRRVRGILA